MAPSAPTSNLAARVLPFDSVRIGHDVKSICSVSEPSAIELTLVEVNMSTPPSCSNRLRSMVTVFVFSIMYAMVVGCAGFRGESNGRAVSQSKEMRASVTPSHTCISWYGCTREVFTCDHAPISMRVLDHCIQLSRALAHLAGSLQMLVLGSYIYSRSCPG